MDTVSKQASNVLKEARSRKLLSVLMAIVMAATLMIPHAAWAEEPESAPAPTERDQTTLDQGSGDETGDATQPEQSTRLEQQQESEGESDVEEGVSTYAAPSREATNDLTVIESVASAESGKSFYNVLYANGKDVVVEPGNGDALTVTVDGTLYSFPVNSASYYNDANDGLTIFAGGDAATTANSSITVKSGAKVGAVFAGGNKADYTGTATVTIEQGAEAGIVYGGGLTPAKDKESSAQTGASVVTVNGTAGIIYGGGMASVGPSMSEVVAFDASNPAQSTAKNYVGSSKVVINGTALYYFGGSYSYGGVGTVSCELNGVLTGSYSAIAGTNGFRGDATMSIGEHGKIDGLLYMSMRGYVGDTKLENSGAINVLALLPDGKNVSTYGNTDVINGGTIERAHLDCGCAKEPVSGSALTPYPDTITVDGIVRILTTTIDENKGNIEVPGSSSTLPEGTELLLKNGATYDGYSAMIGEKGYADLSAAASAAQTGDIVALTADQTSEPVAFASNVTLDLGGNTLTIEGGTADTAYGVQFAGEGSNVLKNGTLLDERSNGNQTAGWKTVHVANKANLATEGVAVKTYKPDTGSNYNYLIYVGGKDDAGAKALSLGAGTELSNLDNSSSTKETYGAVGVSLIGTTSNAAAVTDKVALTIADGVTINTMGYAIAGNGTYHGTEITINGGTVTSTDSAAVYHPQAGSLTLNGGTLEGTTGIQFCSGEGTVNAEFQFNGGTVRGVGADERATKTGDGLVSDGAAISLVNRSYPGGMPSIAINGGTFTSAHNDAVLAYTWAKSASGAYEASDWAEAADKIDITGGTYSNDVSAYVPEEYTVTDNGDGTWSVAADSVAQIGDTVYPSFQKAIENAKDGDTVTLLKDVTLSDMQIIRKSIVLDLGGKKLTSTTTGYAIASLGDELTVKNGTIEAMASDTAALYAQNSSVIVDAGATIKGKTKGLYVGNYENSTGYRGSATINEGASISSVEEAAVYVSGYYSTKDLVGDSLSEEQTVRNTLTVNGGTIASQKSFAISGNGTYAGTEITINGGSITSEEAVAIYHPQLGTLTVAGGTVRGTSGIEMRSGKLSVADEAVVSGIGEFSVSSNGNGSTTEGVGIAVAQHTTKLPIAVTIEGGTISGTYAFHESNPQKNAAEDIAKIALSITGGMFAGTDGTVFSEDCTGFISGGYFTDDPSTFVAAKHVALPSETLGYTVAESKAQTDAKPVVTEPTVTVDPEADLGDETTQKEIVEKVASTEVEGLNAYANDAVENLQQETVDAAEQALKDAINPDASKPITVFVQTYVEIAPKAFVDDSASNTKALTVDITPKTRIVSTTATDVKDIKLEAGADQNAVVVDEQTIEVSSNTVISVPLPAGFVSATTDPVFAKHVKSENLAYVYQAVLNGDAAAGFTATFTNPHGFSEFTLTTTDVSAASIDGTAYATLQAAVDNVTDGQTIKLLKNDENVTISRAVSFTLDANGFTPGTITAASGYVLDVANNVYTVTAVVPVTAVTLDKTSLELVEGDTATLVATVAPDNATDKNVTWSSSNEAAARVSADGTVTAVKAGTATITAIAGGKEVTCSVTVSSKEDPKPQPAGQVARLGGSDRYATMAKVSQTAFPDNGSCQTVVIARGDDYPDALAAAGLAGVLDAQVLLTPTATLTSDAKAEIKRLGATKAYVLGSEDAVSKKTFEEVKSLVGGNAERVGGADRFDTALEIYKAGIGKWGNTAIIACGMKPYDALSASPIAYADNAPIFLATADGSLTSETLAAVKAGGFDKVLIMGSDLVVSSATERELAKIAHVDRFAGSDRYATSRLAAAWALQNGFTCGNVVIAAGGEDRYPDALVASSLGGKSKSPLLLVADGPAADRLVSDVLAPHKAEVDEAYVLGDENAVSKAVFDTIAKAFA